MKKYIAICLLISALTVHPVLQAASRCTLIPDWKSVPVYAQVSLSQEIGKISERNGPFNPTDVGTSDTPRARFFGGCSDGRRLVVAIERGGFSHGLELTEFVSGKSTRKWYGPMPKHEFEASLATPSAER